MSIGLMGFGRIGRNVFRLLSFDPHEVGAIVDTAQPEALAYLLKYDSIYGRFDREVDLDGSTLVVDDARIPILNIAEPGDVDWDGLGVSIVVQATGKYRTSAWCEKHLERGASRVILASTPEVPGDVPILLTGVNDDVLTDDTSVIALGSNTSNAFAPVLKVLNDSFGLERVFFTTVHAFTNKERLADVPGHDFRSSRGAGENIIPSQTNSPEILEHVLPELAGKISAMSLNVPVENGSTVDATARMARSVTVEEVNDVVRAATEDQFKGILGYTDDPIVSSDVRGTPYSGIYDSLATMVVGGSLLKTIVWFDNGWGYSKRVVETINRMSEVQV